MHRRTFLALSAAAAATPLTLRAASLVYTPGLVDQRLADGETVLVDFWTSWCTTCRAQSRVMDALKAANPAYEANITFVRLDWDVFSDDPLSVRLAIPRRSTLVALRGNQELGRIVAGTRESEIKALFDTALAAATAA